MRTKISVLLLLFLSVRALARDIEFQKGVESYMGANYDAAIQSFTRSFESDPSASAAYNLGNSFVRKKDLSKAIFWYRQAQELNPSDPDVNYNLNFARKGVTDNIAVRNRFVNSYSATKVLLLAFVLAVLFAALWVVNAFFPRKSLRAVAFVTLAASLVFVTLFAAQKLLSSPFGVLSATQADVVSSFGQGNAVLFTLHAGAEFDVLDERNGFLQIVVDEKRKGWVETAKVLRSSVGATEVKQ